MDIDFLITIAKLHGSLEALLTFDALDESTVAWIRERALVLVKDCEDYLTSFEGLGDKGGERGRKRPERSESLSEYGAKQPSLFDYSDYEDLPY